MELLKLYSKGKANFIRKGRLILFCLIKLLFVKVRCLVNVNVSLEVNREGQGS